MDKRRAYVRRKRPYLEMACPMILAHQGDSAHAPANTLCAFDLAVQAGADAIETDVHWTKDGVIVISHDDSVDKMSNGSGKIADMTYGALKELDFGYTFTLDEGQTYPFRGRGIRMTTLRAVLERYPETRVNVDIKPAHGADLRQFVSEMYNCKAENRILVASFHDATLRKLRRINKVIATSASVCETACYLFSSVYFRRHHTWPFDAIQVPMNMYGLPVVTTSMLQQSHCLALPVHVWTIDDAVTMKALLNRGVNGIVTNHPKRAVEVRQAWLAENER